MSIKIENISTSKNQPRVEDYKSSDSVAGLTSNLLFVNVFDEQHLNDVDLPKTATEPGWSGDGEQSTSGKDTAAYVPKQQNPSLSNPYFNIRLKNAAGGNYPLTDEQTANAEYEKMFDEVTAFDLINNPRGASVFSAEDFLYLKHYDELPLNRLVTLRRFAHPTFDDIFSKTVSTEPDIARMLTFSDNETNKLSEILSFSAGLAWKKLEAASEAATMEGTDDQSGVTGIAGKVMRLVDPKYGQEKMQGSGRVNYDPQHDTNRVYGPVDSIAYTHIRDVGVDFEQAITLTFKYEMRSHNGINQKAAFLDLLSNMILMTTNNAKFWGGARYWIGPKPSSYFGMLKKYESNSWQEFVGKASTGVKDAIGHFSKPGNAKAMLQNIANNAANLALGKILNQLGRTGVPVMNSLLTGNPVGMWHLTVGNPLNPMMVAGDLIIDKFDVSFGDELGYDDFPTELNVQVSLKHAKPRGAAEIENMFNCGKGRIYLKPKDVFRKNTSNVSSPDSPVTLGNALQVNTTRFGDFKATDVERNYREVWSFLEDK